MFNEEKNKKNLLEKGICSFGTAAGQVFIFRKYNFYTLELHFDKTDCKIDYQMQFEKKDLEQLGVQYIYKTMLENLMWRLHQDWMEF